MSAPPLGQILIGHSLITPKQLDTLLTLQADDARPLGAIAADYYGVHTDAVCDAVAEQMLPNCPRINLMHQSMDYNCLNMLKPKQAWAAILLPLRFEEGVLLCATAAQTLGSALALMQQKTSVPCRFLIAPMHQVEQYICQLYDYEGVEVSEVA